MVSENNHKPDHKGDGIIMLVISVTALVAFILLSEGYDSQKGMLTSLYETMKIIDGQFFCEEKTERVPGGIPYLTTECIYFSMPTKYMVLVCLGFIAYGILIYNGLAKGPRKLIEKIIAKTGHQNKTQEPETPRIAQDPSQKDNPNIKAPQSTLTSNDSKRCINSTCNRLILSGSTFCPHCGTAQT